MTDIPSPSTSRFAVRSTAWSSAPSPAGPSPSGSKRRCGIFRASLGLLGALVFLAACEPRIKIEAPDKPIVINLNVKIEQDVRVRVEKDVEALIKDKREIFE
ncbi:MAG: YnbE family lipoprotein [Rhodospirillales bacterium]|nr:YnbE family lipoprotein [Rhodospirillales bacterium]